MRLCVCIIVSLISAVSSANILVVIATLARSHFVVFDVLMKELVERGHQVTVITTFPQENPITNLTEINVRGDTKNFLSYFSVQDFVAFPVRFQDVHFLFFDRIKRAEIVLNNPDVLNIINSNIKFDLIMYETFAYDIFVGFAHKFKAPVITMSSCYMFPWVADRFGIPANPSHFPGFYSGYSTNMNFYERFYNTILDVSNRIFFKFFLEPKTTEAMRRVFGKDTPPVIDLVKNTSLYLITTHFSYFGAQAYPPQVVDVSGIHLKPVQPLPQELDQWLNESAAGVVYFSFGSMLRASTLPTEKVKAFLQVFGTLPQRVLWKWEEDIVEGLPTNVRIMKWLPQRDILAHPKVRVFISHGGLLGTTEAVVSGVPILGIPMYGDQPNNVAALVEKGVAVHVDYNNISVASLSYALNTLLTDERYSENSKLLSRRFLDRPVSPLDTAVYWTEYVIRHRGAPHLQSAAVHLTWYQYYLLDVFAVILALLCLIFIVFYYVIKSCTRFLFSAKSIKLKTA